LNKVLEKSYSQGVFQVYADKPQSDLIHVHQIHSNIVLTEEEFSDPNQKADGVIFSYKTLNEKNLTLAIKTADCLPILYIGETHVGLVHAGWKGVQQKIHLHPELLKIKPTEIYIGPCIHVNSFEVQEDFKEFFPKSSNFMEQDGKLYFDLVKEALGQLSQAFPDTKITESGICTFENNQYNSYRLNKTEKRNWNIFQTRG